MFLNFLKIRSFLIIEYKKKPIVTTPNLIVNAAKGVASSTITFPVMKADDHKSINNKGKDFVI